MTRLVKYADPMIYSMLVKKGLHNVVWYYITEMMTVSLFSHSLKIVILKKKNIFCGQSAIEH